MGTERMSENYKLTPEEIPYEDHVHLDAGKYDGLKRMSWIEGYEYAVAKVLRLQAITDRQLKKEIKRILIWVGVDRTVDIAFSQIDALYSAKIQEARAEVIAELKGKLAPHYKSVGGSDDFTITEDWFLSNEALESLSH